MMNKRKRGRIREARKARENPLEFARKAAGNIPLWMQTIAFNKSSEKKELQRHYNRKLGTFGAASSVRHIDPSEYGVKG